MNEGNIVIAAGFQGIDENFNITTLGRGGSDTTAVALAAVLNASCEIYTDVDGVYTTDPRQLPEARRVKRISYDEMLELASLGAAVMHSRSIEFAKKFNVPIYVRSSFSDVPGTMIIAEPESAKQAVSGAALVKDEARITIEGVPDRPGVSHAIFSRLAKRHIAVDMIVQERRHRRKADISFTVPRDDVPTTLEAAREAVAELGAAGVSHDDDVAKLSVVGLGMARQTGVAQKNVPPPLGEAGVNIETITTSEIKISVLVARSQALAALRAVHAAFGLDKQPSSDKPGDSGAHATVSTALEIVRQLQGMEDLTIDEIDLDEKQARVSIDAVPDKPGTAAALFDAVASAGIFVDMIVQSYSRAGKANLTFTVPEADLARSAAIAEKVATQAGCGSVATSTKIDKISVQGIGMRSHSGVALGYFARCPKLVSTST